MPKSHRKKTRRGGSMWDDLKNKTSGWTSGLNTGSWTSGISSLNPFAKKETTNTSTTNYETASSPTTYTSSTTNYETSTTPTTSYGGKRRRVKRGGSYSANMSLTNLAASASPVSGIQTVKAQTWVGGKTKRRCRRNKHNKSCKHRKH